MSWLSVIVILGLWLSNGVGLEVKSVRTFDFRTESGDWRSNWDFKRSWLQDMNLKFGDASDDGNEVQNIKYRIEVLRDTKSTQKNEYLIRLTFINSKTLKPLMEVHIEESSDDFADVPNMIYAKEPKGLRVFEEILFGHRIIVNFKETCILFSIDSIHNVQHVSTLCDTSTSNRPQLWVAESGAHWKEPEEVKDPGTSALADNSGYKLWPPEDSGETEVKMVILRKYQNQVMNDEWESKWEVKSFWSKKEYRLEQLKGLQGLLTQNCMVRLKHGDSQVPVLMEIPLKLTTNGDCSKDATKIVHVQKPTVKNPTDKNARMDHIIDVNFKESCIRFIIKSEMTWASYPILYLKEVTTMCKGVTGDSELWTKDYFPDDEKQSDLMAGNKVVKTDEPENTSGQEIVIQSGKEEKMSATSTPTPTRRRKRDRILGGCGGGCLP